jgi:hypothetical protein
MNELRLLGSPAPGKGMAVVRFAQTAMYWDEAESLHFLKKPDDLFS